MEGGGGEGEDIISQLPDPILQHILSFIDINQALQTTILSTRWRNLCFSLFVSHYLSRRDASSAIRNFHLSFDSYQLDVDAEFVEKCVSYAIDHGVESLHLRAFCHQILRLPATFYSCKSLRELKLTHFSHHGIYLPKGLSFPNLKTLYLEESAFLYDDVHGYSYRNEPFSGFPELEKLILRQSIQVDWLVISAPKLRFLEIIHDRLYSQVIQEISAPLPP